MIDKEKLKRRFSKGAKEYDSYANVQKVMGDKLLSKVKNRDILNILEVGCGTGYVTSKLRKIFPNAHIDGVDIAPGMIKYARSKEGLEEVNFICGDIEAMELDKEYDLIISNATFQWFNDLNGSINKLMSAIKYDGQMIFSTFGKNTFMELKEAFEKASVELDVEAIQPSQRFITSEELSSMIKYDFTIYEDDVIEYFQDCNGFFTSVKKIGANNSTKKRGKATPTFMKKVVSIYDRDYKEVDGVRATYHTMIISIEK